VQAIQFLPVPPEGLSLLEMMVVVTLASIMASITTPIHRTSATWVHETVLRHHL
jgi:prepilin-type N-terminal cleavage/methylation domain-containing protein